MEKDIKDKTPINTLPEFQIRTMKDDLASQGLDKEVKRGGIPEKLPIAPEKISLPGIEELIAKEEKSVKGKEAEKEKLFPQLKPKEKEGKPKLSIILVIITLILAGGVLFFYWQGLKPWTSIPEEQPEEQPQPELIKPSESLITVDETKIISPSTQKSFPELLKEEVRIDQLAGTFKRIAVLKNEKEFFSLTELFEKMQLIVPPYALTELLGPNYTLALYNQNGKKHLVLINEIKNSENLKEQLNFWEKTMFNDLKNFFLVEISDQPIVSEFTEIKYPETIEPEKQITIHYLSFSDPDITFDYTVVKNLFVLTTSREATYKIVDNLLKTID